MSTPTNHRSHSLTLQHPSSPTILGLEVIRQESAGSVCSAFDFQRAYQANIFPYILVLSHTHAANLIQTRAALLVPLKPPLGCCPLLDLVKPYLV